MSQPGESSDAGGGAVPRRMVLRGVTVGGAALPLLPLLTACGGSGAGESPDDAGETGGGGGPASIATSEVPEGGGTVLTEELVVVTQPTPGTFKAFTAVCTHQGCTVTKVEGGQIVCPCHGSEFSIEDGSNTKGPNDTAAGSVADLQAKKVSVEGDRISVS